MRAKLGAAGAVIALVLSLAGNASAAAPAARHIASFRQHAAVSADALKCSPRRHHRLIWYGGPVGDPGYVVIVYWGSWWRHHGGAVEAELDNLFDGLGTSSWAATLKQYCDASGPPKWASKPAIAFPDFRNPPKAPTNNQIKSEVNWARSRLIGGQPTFVIVTSPGIAPATDTKHHFCGQHGWTANKSGGPDIPWADVPYGIIGRNHGCGWGLRQGVPGALSVVAGHEWAESVTDPFINSGKPGSGWATSGKRPEEVADLCEPEVVFHIFHSHVFVLKLKTGRFVMQELWSNAAGKCVRGS